MSRMYLMIHSYLNFFDVCAKESIGSTTEDGHDHLFLHTCLVVVSHALLFHGRWMSTDEMRYDHPIKEDCEKFRGMINRYIACILSGQFQRQ